MITKMRYLMTLALSRNIRHLLLLFGGILFAVNSWAQKLPEPMSPPRLVNDFGHYLTEPQRIESKLIAYNKATTNQIAVVLLPTTNGDDISDFAIKLFNKWGIGSNAEKDNGVLILLAVDDRKLFIVTGRGVEDVLPDIRCRHIITEDMTPLLRKGDYDGAVSAGVEKIQAYLTGTTTVDEQKEPQQNFPPIIFIVVIVLIILIIRFIFPGGGSTISRGGYNAGWIGGGWSGGGGWSNGGSGGGFGGFGGGSSGGGGAGGSW
jgi:uncharacterized protein